MKIVKPVLALMSVMLIFMLIACSTTSKAGTGTASRVRIVELENKGSSMDTPTPEWIKTYTANGISRVQAQPEFKDKYCIIGEESGVNRQFVVTWADNFSAQQRIGAMLRTTIVSEYTARIQGAAQTSGGANSSTAVGASSGEFKQEIDSSINAIVNVSYSGAQREADWWSLRRRYDPDQKDVFSDEYTAYVLYTFPKAEMNRQVARALETSVAADSALYQITIELARQILLDGMDWGGGELPPPATPPQTPQAVQEIKSAGATAKITVRNGSYNTGSVMSSVKIFSGYEAKGEPYLVYSQPVLGNQQASWDLPEGVYTVEVFLNNSEDSIKAGLIGGGTATVGITAGDIYVADFNDGRISSFTRK